MIICPDCGHENIPGADHCDDCGQSLSPLSKPTPSMELELRLTKDRISTLESKPPLAVTPDRSVGEVLSLMVDERIGCVLVCDGDKLVGVFSERDALMRLGVDVALYRDRPISEFLTPSPVTLECKHKIAFALHKMDLGGYRHIPVTTDGKVTGIISIRDILKYMASHLPVGAG